MKCDKCGKVKTTEKINGMWLCGLCGMKHIMDTVTLLGSVPPPTFALPALPVYYDFSTPEPHPLLGPTDVVVKPFAELTPADPALEAIGRAFDDAIDLAYLT